MPRRSRRWSRRSARPRGRLRLARRGSRSRRSRLVHRHPHRPRAGPRDGARARRFRWSAFRPSSPSPRRCSASRGRGSSPRRSTPVTARSISSCSRRPAVRWAPPLRHAARMRARRSARGRRCWPATRPTLVAAEAHRAGLPYDLGAAADAPDIVAVARIGLALDPADDPARPLYVKPPDARPNPASRSPHVRLRRSPTPGLRPASTAPRSSGRSEPTRPRPAPACTPPASPIRGRPRRSTGSSASRSTWGRRRWIRPTARLQGFVLARPGGRRGGNPDHRGRSRSQDGASAGN